MVGLGSPITLGSLACKMRKWSESKMGYAKSFFSLKWVRAKSFKKREDKDFFIGKESL